LRQCEKSVAVRSVDYRTWAETEKQTMETTTPLDVLLEKLNSNDPDDRTEAWLSAAEIGVPAIQPLASIMARSAPVVAALAKELAVLERSVPDEETREKIVAKQAELNRPLEASRAAKRGLWKIVRHVGRPGAREEKEAAVAELLNLLNESLSVAIRREAVCMLSEIANETAVDAIADLLDSEELRDDACIALERIPTKTALAALQAALVTAPDDFKVTIARSLRARGMEVPDLPSEGDERESD
jgi:hypothetical protein